MSSPILHGTALCPLLRFPRGGRTQIRVVMDEALDLATGVDDILFAARARYGANRATLRYSRSGTAEAWTAAAPNTATLSLAPDAADETEDSERTLADLHDKGAAAWRMDFLAADGLPLARIQGDIEYLPEEGDWTDDPASETTLPSLTLSLVNGAVAVTVSLIGEGAAVDNAAVVAAIGEDPEAARTALELGSAALAEAGDFEVAGAAAALEASLGTMSAQAASSVAITGGTISGITDLAVADGGTGASNAADARTNLGLVIGTDVLAPSGSGASLTSLNPSALGTGTGAVSVLAGGSNQNVEVTPSGTGAVWLLSSSAGVGIKAFPNSGLPAIDFAYFGTTRTRIIGIDGGGWDISLRSQGGNGNIWLIPSGSGDIYLQSPAVLASYTVGTVPTASAHTRGMIWVSNEAGGATPAYSDGTDWRRVSDRAVVS